MTALSQLTTKCRVAVPTSHSLPSAGHNWGRCFSLELYLVRCYPINVRVSRCTPAKVGRRCLVSDVRGETARFLVFSTEVLSGRKSPGRNSRRPLSHLRLLTHTWRDKQTYAEVTEGAALGENDNYESQQQRKRNCEERSRRARKLETHLMTQARGRTGRKSPMNGEFTD